MHSGNSPRAEKKTGSSLFKRHSECARPSKQFVWQDPILMFSTKEDSLQSLLQVHARKKRVEGCHWLPGKCYHVEGIEEVKVYDKEMKKHNNL